MNVAAIPDTLLEAEFFGTSPSAYTGADRRGRDGKFVLANGGTLFLDEVGDMPMAMQAKLLRVLQEKEVEPLGSNRVTKVDVRVVAASSVDLRQMVSMGRFRSDLYYRLSVLPIELPPLRERIADLELLCDHILEDIARARGRPQRELTPTALAVLSAYAWPGNIRELRNVLEQVTLNSDNPRLSAEEFTPGAAARGPARARRRPPDAQARRRGRRCRAQRHPLGARRRRGQEDPRRRAARHLARDAVPEALGPHAGARGPAPLTDCPVTRTLLRIPGHPRQSAFPGARASAFHTAT